MPVGEESEQISPHYGSQCGSPATESNLRMNVEIWKEAVPAKSHFRQLRFSVGDDRAMRSFTAQRMYCWPYGSYVTSWIGSGKSACGRYGDSGVTKIEFDTTVSSSLRSA
jgi:hypothetical protein